MIKIPNPSMCLNAEGFDAQLMSYKMWNTRTVTRDVTPYWLAANIASVAAGAPGKQLATLIFNCHGFVTPTGEFLGLDLGTSVYYEDLNHFSRLRPMVREIFMTVCGAARGKSGEAFCKRLAALTGAYVIAGEQDQTLPISVAAKLPGGWIDDFEGKVYKFGPTGKPGPYKPGQ